jgi:hypothetical protein
VETIDAVDFENEQLWYEIVSGDPEQYFIMWPDSPTLILAKRIPTSMDFKLNISISDGLNPVFVQVNNNFLSKFSFNLISKKNIRNHKV